MIPTLLVAAAAMALMTDARDPISLSAHRNGPVVQLQVIGNSDVVTSASYELVAISGSGNRSVQSGRVTLSPDKRVVLVSLGLGNAGRDWSAELKVDTPQGRYERRLSGE